MPPSPPPLTLTCGCTIYLDGLSTSTLAADTCVKLEGRNRVCRPMQSLQCNSDHTRCYNPDDSVSTCGDTPGIWMRRKCAKKLSKGKCNKRKVRLNCPGTCGYCRTYG